MVADLRVNVRHSVSFEAFLNQRDYDVEVLSESVFQVTRTGELPVFIHHRANSLFFEVDLGSIHGLDAAVYPELLHLNTDILPVSVGIDGSNPEDPRLVLVESREAHNLDENELLSVMGALELATDKVAEILKNRM